MTWTLVGVGAPVEVASGSVTASLPAGTQAGDLLIADIGYRDAPAFSAPSGWTLIAQINDPSDTRTDAYADAGVAQAYCVRGASAPDLTFARTLGNAAIVLVRAYRVSSAVSLDTHVTYNSGGFRYTSHSIDAPTTGADNALIVATIPQQRIGDSITGLNAVDPGTGTDGTPDIVSAPGSAWRTRFNSGTTLGADVRLYGFDAVKAAAGSTGTITWTQTGTVSGKAVVSSFSYAAGGAVSITAITASNITQTGATITVTRSNPAAGTLYLAIYPSGITPTWSIGSGWSGTPVYTDADTDPGTGATYQFVPDASGLSAGTQYVPWAVWYDGTMTVGPTQGTTFETLAATANLTPQDASHAHTADNLALSVGLSLAVQDAAHAHAADNLTANTGLSLAIQDALHSHAADTAVLAAALSLVVQSASHAHTTDAATLSAALTLAVQDALHAHATDAPTLSADTPSSQTLSVADATHAHLADALALAGSHTLVVQDSLHSHTVGALTLSAALNLLVDNALHAQLADNVALTDSTAANLVAQNASHSHLADALTLSGALALLVQDAQHAHLSEQATLSAAHSLMVQNAAHAHLADVVDASSGLALSIANAFHAHLADNVDADTALSLAIHDALHTHQAEAATLTAALTLIVSDAIHTHFADQAEFFIPVPLVDQLRRSVFLRIAQQHPFVRVAERRVFIRVQ